jgi:uncharacterized protein (DUF4415 family)
MSRRIIRKDVTIPDWTPLSAALVAELADLRAMPDETIDTSDIPQLTDDFWKQAVRNPFYKPVKASTTVRIDTDVLLWLRMQGRGYQSRINMILRREMLAAIDEAAASVRGGPAVRKGDG